MEIYEEDGYWYVIVRGEARKFTSEGGARIVAAAELQLLKKEEEE